MAFHSDTSDISLWVIPAIYRVLQNHLPDWFLKVFFLFMLHASKALKSHLVLGTLTLIFFVLLKTAVRLLIFLFEVFYSFFTYIVLEHFSCLLHH